MKKITLLLLLLPFLGLSQVQIGQDILGLSESHQLGADVSISDNGNIIAIGVPGDDPNGNASGSVKVFSNINGDWIQIGENINGESESDFFGLALDLSSDGSILAIGAHFNGDSGNVRIFENQSGVWTQIGQDIDGESIGDQSGWSVSISSDGTIVAIGAPENFNGGSAGHVRIYENQSGVWTQIGQDIDGEANGDKSGRSVSLSLDGNIVAIGASNNDENGFHSGHVRIYENQSGVWTQIGQDLDGYAQNDNFGRSVSLSSDGYTVAIGSRLSSSPPFSGYAKVYKLQDNSWIQVGLDLNGDGVSDHFGWDIKLSSNGNLLAVSAFLNDSNGSDSGQIKIFYFNSINWIQVGDDILGEDIGVALGYSIDMTSDGNSIITGTPFFDGNVLNAGLARVFSIASELAIIEVVDDIQGNLNGINVTATQLNSINGVSGAIEGVNYTTALDNGTFVDENNPTTSEIQAIIDQVNDALSLNENDVFNFKIYPNPTKTQFTIQLDPSVQLEKVSIYNTLGQVVLTSEENTINTSKLSSGSYIVDILTNKGKSSKKLIIE
ncbi:MAG: hypothetical protein ACJAZK_002187 [Psychroserpens sp.]|jgi:hypothetical protein|uniref:T9SS type A sorting domain-containing protein n=1 Tax=Psychroserpens sp. TaxID=2020870 RepID=UPI0039E68198